MEIGNFCSIVDDFNGNDGRGEASRTIVGIANRKLSAKFS
jgi:hypothetical protein